MNTHCRFTKSVPLARGYCLSDLAQLQAATCKCKIQHYRVLICDQVEAGICKPGLADIFIRTAETPILIFIFETKR